MMDSQLPALPKHEELRASRRNSNIALTNGSRPATHEGHVASSPIGNGHNAFTSPKRRPSSIGVEDEQNRLRQLMTKLSGVLAERAKLNPSLRGHKRASYLEDDSTEISNILKAESQFAPCVNLNGEFTMVDALGEEVDCALMDAIDNFGHSTLFLPEDEEVLQVFFREVSNKLHGMNGKTFSRRRGTKLSSLVQMDAALLEGYAALKQHLAGSVKADEAPKAVVPLTKHHSFVLQGARIPLVDKWSFDPFDQSDKVLMDAAFQMINDFALIDKFNIDPAKLRNLISSARKNYRPNAFHNFYHGFGVMHLSFQILRRGGAEYLTSLDILAVLVGALCHDLDHPGNNNAFEVSSGSELANIYSDDAVLERYHIYMTHKLMKNADADILSGLTAAERAEFRSIVTAGIMATDMSKHFALTEKLVGCSKNTPPFLVQDLPSRTALVGFIIHCADIGAQTQRKDLALKWGSRVLDEFREQASNEAKLGIPTAPFMMGLESELAAMKLQQGFVAGIVVPLWSALADCLPKLRPCVDRAMVMKTHYEERVVELTEKPCPLSRGVAPLSPRNSSA